MKAFFVIFLFAASWSTTAAEVENEVEVPKIFEDGEVAEAADFNANFDYLEDKITALNEGAPWISGTPDGSKFVEVDCSSDPAALVQAYQDNVGTRQLVLAAKGDCYGALDLIPFTNEDGEPAVSFIQTKSQSVTIFPQDFSVLKIIPRPITSGDDNYLVARLVSSFGSMISVSNLTVQLGADDSWGLLFSRSSNGSVSDVEIIGAAETNQSQVGIRVQNGANTYLVNSSIKGVSDGLIVMNGATVNLSGEIVIEATTRGIWGFIEASIQALLSGNSSITSPEAVALTLGSTGWFSGGATINGNIGVGDSSFVLQGNVVVSENTSINLYNSSFNLWGADAEVAGLTVDMFSCGGPSNVGVTGLEFTNQNGNGCLDGAGWGSVKAQQTSSSKMGSPVRQKTYVPNSIAPGEGISPAGVPGLNTFNELPY